jgi:hypothetical protein
MRADIVLQPCAREDGSFRHGIPAHHISSHHHQTTDTEYLRRDLGDILTQSVSISSIFQTQPGRERKSLTHS